MNKKLADIIKKHLNAHLAMTKEEIQAMPMPQDDSLYVMLEKMAQVNNILTFKPVIDLPFLSQNNCYNSNSVVSYRPLNDADIYGGEFKWVA